MKIRYKILKDEIIIGEKIINIDKDDYLIRISIYTNMIGKKNKIYIIRDNNFNLKSVEYLSDNKNILIKQSVHGCYEIISDNKLFIKGNFYLDDEIKFIPEIIKNIDGFINTLWIDNFKILPYRIQNKNNSYNILAPEYSYIKYNKDKLYTEYYENLLNNIKIEFLNLGG